MSLSKKLKNYFDAQVRERGVFCYNTRSVKIVEGSESDVAARVAGSHLYQVNLKFKKGNTLAVECDCPYFDRAGACKHLWATILAAEAMGYLFRATSAKHLSLEENYHGDTDEEVVFEDELDTAVELPGSPPATISRVPVTPKPAPKVSGWRKHIAEITGTRAQIASTTQTWPESRQIIYIVDITRSKDNGCLSFSLEWRERKRDGSWKRSKALSVKHSDIARLPSAEDREILSMLGGSRQDYGFYSYTDNYQLASSCIINHPLSAIVMPLLVRTERCFLRETKEGVAITSEIPLKWDGDGSWRFALRLHNSARGGCQVSGALRREGQEMDLSIPLLVTEGGCVFTRDAVAALAEDTPFEWLSYLRRIGPIEVPRKDQESLLSELLGSGHMPKLEVPEELSYAEVMLSPRACLRISELRGYSKGQLRADVSFDYEGRSFPEREPARGWYDAANRRFCRRNAEAEKAAIGVLAELDFKPYGPTYWDPTQAWQIAASKLPRILPALLEASWHVDAEGKVFRRPGAFRMDVSSGVDWFELRGEVQYGETTAQLPELLQALRRGDTMVQLGNGEYGMLPEEWLRRFGHIASMGTATNGHLRFQRSQAGFLDAILASQPETSCDETFARVRKELALFEGVHAAEQPVGFAGQLRDYQREGLGWMNFLRQFSFGGCLADDMGVGKTAQVLALLESRRESKAVNGTRRPSLVVVPKSLVFNWKQEAARFTPHLRVLDYTGTARASNGFSEYDIVLTTYGTMRRDILVLKDIDFDYVILDEAQAVKNANTDSSKAVRLLRGENRLALSGTPIENHLGELWTLFEFLNPGMLGGATAFKVISGGTRNPDEESRKLLASALRPFILRRTKEQVARELPPKTEQTIHCEMEPAQRKLYNELLLHYRNSLLARIETEGLAKSKIQVLEALLRLRQAACHPGLIDRKRSQDSSAKLDVLLARIQEVLDEGHKALVFSQFTTFLKMVRDRLDDESIPYEYLDGATRDRQARVDRFQNQPDCKLFLVSLKAGGLGLNLTAAEYVFLLDPWWNPAVEAQAVDRAHRIGQTRHVFAYRLIARDTVEEKVLQLQETKRDLAAAIISADNRLIRNLRREDLEILLS